MMVRDMTLWRLKSCSRCRGDLAMEEGEWRCFQCGHYYYPNTLEPVGHPPDPDPLRVGGLRRRRKSHGGIAGRNINAVIRARSNGNEEWWSRNRQIIAYLEGGLTVREIARLTARSPRKIREVRERLADFRAQAPD